MFPIGSMYYFGSPDFFEKYVKDLKFWPEEEKTNRPPVEKEDIKSALEELKKQRLARRALREQHQQDLPVGRQADGTSQ